MVRLSIFAALLSLACGAYACSSDSKSAPVANGADAGDEAGSSSGDPDGDGDFGEQPMAECIVTSIGIWDDFEALPDGTGARFTPAGTTAFSLDGQFHCGAQSLKATVNAGSPATFVRDVPALPTPTVAVSWSFLVSFEDAAISNRFAELLMANGKRLAFQIDQGNLALVEKDDAELDAAAEVVHAGLGTVEANAWTRIDIRIEYATKVATLKVGPPGGTGPDQATIEKTLTLALDRVTAEHLGPTPPATGSVIVRYDRAAVFVE